MQDFVEHTLRDFLDDLLGHRLRQILHEEHGKIMAALDDLKGAVASLGVSISNELTAISEKVSSIGSGSGTSDVDIEAVVAQIELLKEQVDAETASLTAPTPTPTPVPVPLP